MVADKAQKEEGEQAAKVEEIDGEEWTKLFGVNSSDALDFEHPFWTTKVEYQAEQHKNHFNQSFKVKEYFLMPVSKIMIVA